MRVSIDGGKTYLDAESVRVELLALPDVDGDPVDLLLNVSAEGLILEVTYVNGELLSTACMEHADLVAMTR